MADLTLTLPLAPDTTLERSLSFYRRDVAMDGPEERAHLEAARSLDVGPRPLEPGGRTVSGALDVIGFRLLRRFFSRTHRGELEEADYDLLEGGWLQRAARGSAAFFPAPAAPEVTTERRGSLPGGELVDLRFSSVPYSARAAAQQLLHRYPANANALARCYHHHERGRPAVLWLHGWGMGFHAVESFVSRARRLYDLGLDVYLYVLPYHAERRPPGVVFAGSVFPTTQMTRTNEAFFQAAWECRSLVAWHRAQGGGPCGVVGLSLGGYLAAVLASVTRAAELACAVCLMPVADIPTLMWSNGEGTEERRRAEEAGITFDMFCRSMALHAPLAHRPALERERLLLVGARGDHIIPPQHTTALWEHWGRPALHWIEGSHLLHVGRRGYLERVEAFLRERGLAA
jgi:dienelactone hydrolase